MKFFSPAVAGAVLSLLLVGTCVSQDASALFRKAPPEVEESLRTTVRIFLDLQMEKKWGAAMKYVDEDSLDAYIGSEKDACLALEVFHVTYGEDFKEATVGVLCERGMATPVGGGRVQMPFTTYWKLVDGDWKWFTPKFDRPPEDEMVMTPFGPVPRYSPDQLEKKGAARTEKESAASKFSSGPSVKDLESPLRVEPAKVILRADDESSAVAKIRNSFAGLMRIDLKWVRLDGLSATADKTELQAGETAEITIRFTPPGIAVPPETHAVWVETNPMRSATPILIEFRYEEQVGHGQD